MKKPASDHRACEFAALPPKADVTVMSWGGAYGEAQNEAIVKPFEAEKTGNQDGHGGCRQPRRPIKAMVEAGNVTVDVASVEYADAIRLCDEGMLEPIDPAIAARPAPMAPRPPRISCPAR
jgi:putative spermidine/putrescine transport system substrate-binding protein